MLGEVLFEPKAPGNLISPAALIDEGWKVEYSNKNDTFRAVKDKIPLKFSRNGRLYTLDEPKALNSSVSMNKQKKFDEITALHNALGHPSNETMIKGIQSGIYKTNIKVEDIKLYINQVEPCSYCIQGKGKEITRSAKKSRKSIVPGDVLHMDIGKYKGIYYLMVVEESTRYCWAIPMKSKDENEVFQAIEEVRLDLKSFDQNYSVTEIHADRDKSFTANRNKWANDGITLYISSTQGHDPISERAICTLQGIMRTIQASLSYQILNSMVKYLIRYAAQCMSIRTNKALWESGYSPFYKLSKGKHKMDWNFLKASFGEILLWKVPYLENKPKDTERYQWGIVLGRELNSNGSFIVLLLEDHSIVSRGTFNSYSKVPEALLKELQDIGKKEEFLDEKDQNFLINEDDIDYENIKEVNKDENTGVEEKIKSSLLVPNFSTRKSKRIPKERKIFDPSQNKSKYSINQVNSANNLSATMNEEKEMQFLEDCVVENSNREGIEEKMEETNAIALFSLRQALIKDANKAETAYKAEIEQMLRQEVFNPVKKEDIEKEVQMVNLITIFNEKADKFKCRIVADGSRQKVNDYNIWDISATTASIPAIMAVLSIAVNRNLILRTLDVTGAYLFAPIKKKVCVRIDKQLTERLIKLKPEWKKFKNEDGAIYAILNKALYGLKESASLWQDHFTESFKTIGYKPIPQDPGILKNNENIVCIHVDDALTASQSETQADKVTEGLTKIYGALKEGKGNKLVWRGIQIDQYHNLIKVHQTQYIKQMLDDYNIKKISVTPGVKDFYQVEEGNPTDQKEFHKLVAKLLWIANISRPDIKFEVACLSTRVQNPTKYDYKKAIRVLQYLNGTSNYGIEFKKGSTNLKFSVDASFMTHPDMKGHSGIAGFMGDNLIYSLSKKQKTVAGSSTEAEMIALNTATEQIVNLMEIIEEIGLPRNTTIVEQDNQSAINAVLKTSNTTKLKHFIRKQLQVKQFVEDGTISLKHTGTNDIVADILTKSLIGDQFRIKRDILLGNNMNGNKIDGRVGIQDKNDVLSSNIKENQVKNDNHDATNTRSSLTSIISLSNTSDDIIRDISNRYPEEALWDVIDPLGGCEILRDSTTNDYKVDIYKHS